MEPETKDRLAQVLEKVNKDTSLVSVKEEWIFQESQDITSFVRNFFEHFVLLKIQLEQLLNKNFLCGSSKGRHMKKIN